jgi:hypothetical protein
MRRYLAGKGFLWIDMQDGIGLDGFFFHPTNGEPTPTVNIFSKQVQKEMLLEWSELPPAFAEDAAAWEQADAIITVSRFCCFKDSTNFEAPAMLSPQTVVTKGVACSYSGNSKTAVPP